MQLSSPFALDFAGVGPQRTGTSWLHAILATHPEVCLPHGVKETMFFDAHWERGLAEHARYFERRAPGQVTGEWSPTYFDDAEAARRLQVSYPRARMIITLREPVARTVSLFEHHAAKGRVPHDFRAAVRDLPRIVESGRYSLHVPRWLELFGRERVHFILLDDLEDDPQGAIDVLCAFIGVGKLHLRDEDRRPIGAALRARHGGLARVAARAATALRARRLHWAVELGKKLGFRTLVFGNRGGRKPQVSPGDLRWLEDRHREDAVYVEALLGRKLDRWRDPIGALERSSRERQDTEVNAEGLPVGPGS